MRQFTKQEIETLSQFEETLNTATYCKYYRNISAKKLDEIKAVYEAASGEPYGANWSCNHCILTFLQTVGRKYFDDLEKIAMKEIEMMEAVDQLMNDVPETVEKPKKPAVKKTNNSKTKKTSKK